MNDRMGTVLENDEKITEGGKQGIGQIVDHVYTLGSILQGRKDAGLFLSRCSEGL